MTENFEQIREMLLAMVSDTAGAVIAFTPKLIGGLLVLFVGWLIARLVQAVVSRSIRAGLDTILERTGAMAALERTNMTMTPSMLIGRVLYWIIMILFVMAASRVLGLDAVSDAITRILGYLPSVISAALVLAAGIFLSRFVGNLVTTGADAASISYARGLGSVAQTSIIVMVGVVTLEQLGVDTQILVTVITVSVAAIVFGMALAFSLGATAVVRGILASHYLKQTLDEGARIQAGDVEGVIESIGPVSTTVRDGQRTWRVPNTRLVDEVVVSEAS